MGQQRIASILYEVHTQTNKQKQTNKNKQKPEESPVGKLSFSLFVNAAH